MDPWESFKAAQREVWSHFAPMEVVTTIPAAALVDYAGVHPGERVLDVACGTGVVALAAARVGAVVSALDLSPVLVAKATENARVAGLDLDVVEGDAEALPYEDASVDVVLSQFGHMFAPRPEVVTAEMLRVLRPGGRVAFSTWPPEMCVGQLFTLSGRYAPAPPPEGAAAPTEWGDPETIRRRLGDGVADLEFERGLLRFPALSVAHFREMMENTAMVSMVRALAGSDPERLAAFRADVEALASRYFAGNAVRQHFLMTRATKAG
jgi:SAM-dependent methyltransferase